jgi:hypothetical protein
MNPHEAALGLRRTHNLSLFEIKAVKDLLVKAIVEERLRCANIMLSVCGHDVHATACTWCLMSKRIREGE